jgi:hypothetical protein
MISLNLAIKILLLVPSIIFFFYSAVYLLLFELNVQPHLSKMYRNIAFTLLGGSAILITLYMII